MKTSRLYVLILPSENGEKHWNDLSGVNQFNIDPVLLLISALWSAYDASLTAHNALLRMLVCMSGWECKCERGWLRLCVYINTAGYKKIIMCYRNIANNGAIISPLLFFPSFSPCFFLFTTGLFVTGQECKNYFRVGNPAVLRLRPRPSIYSTDKSGPVIGRSGHQSTPSICLSAHVMV